MANSLWAGAFRKGTAANKPATPQFADDTFGFYYETDTGILNYGAAGASGWMSLGKPGVMATPVAKTGDATLTIAELMTGTITATKATAVAFTLPTGTLTDAGFLGGTAAVNQYFDWFVINLGSSSGATTLNAGTDHTIVGNAVVAISTTARFRTRKTLANTFVTYRLA
jgi:hypothetical protein